MNEYIKESTYHRIVAMIQLLVLLVMNKKIMFLHTYTVLLLHAKNHVNFHSRSKTAVANSTFIRFTEFSVTPDLVEFPNIVVHGMKIIYFSYRKNTIIHLHEK